MNGADFLRIELNGGTVVLAVVRRDHAVDGRPPHSVSLELAPELLMRVSTYAQGATFDDAKRCMLGLLAECNLRDARFLEPGEPSIAERDGARFAVDRALELSRARYADARPDLHATITDLLRSVRREIDDARAVTSPRSR